MNSLPFAAYYPISEVPFWYFLLFSFIYHTRNQIVNWSSYFAPKYLFAPASEKKQFVGPYN